MKKICIILISFLLLLTTTGCGNKKDVNQLDSIKERGKISLGVAPDYAPYEFYLAKDGKVEVVGADIQLAEEIAKELGVKLEIVQLSFDALLPALSSGRVDMVISGMNPNEKRRKVVDFSDIYFAGGSAFLINNDREDIKSIEDVKKMKIGVQKGAVQEKFLLEEINIPRENLQSLADVPSVIQDLKNKNIDAAFLAEDVSKIALHKEKSLIFSNFKFEKDAEAEGMAVASRKGNNKDLIEKINKVVNKQYSEKIFENELEKYATLAAEYQELK